MSLRSKRVIRCLGCERIKRYSDSFKVRILETTKNILTGEKGVVEIEGRICRGCAEEAGYRVKKRKWQKKEVAQNKKENSLN